MQKTTYHVTLSTSGQHTISVTGDDPVAIQDDLAWARGIYLKLKTYDVSPTAEGLDPEPPTCTVHDVPMVLVQGKKGPFWSCHEKNSDGTWCSYKPEGR